MKPVRVDQLLAGLAEGDAISQDARVLREVLSGLGFQSDLFAPAACTAPEMRTLCRPAEDYRGGPGSVLIYHYGMASPVTEIYRGCSACRVLRYHNITPGEYFDGFDESLAGALRRARAELAELVRAAAGFWPVSEFNAAELRGLGAGTVRALPLLFPPRRFEVGIDESVRTRYGGGLTNLLFVGRLVPNKRVEDLILMFAEYQRRLNPLSRLILVGSERSCPRYYAMLRMLAAELGLPNVCFEGYLLEGGLAACYQTAQVFVCASAHEGYCLPLLEAMCFGLPVIARSSGGVPEALGGAGVLYENLTPVELAGLVHRVTADAVRRQTILDSQQERLEALRKRDPAGEIAELLKRLDG